MPGKLGTRRDFLRGAGAAAVGLACGAWPRGLAAGSEQPDKRAGRPNVILFLVDDMGWMDSSAYGSKYYRTPQMERLARQGMRFTDAYALPLCSPTRASILSGQHSSRHGVTSAVGHLPPAAADAPRYPAKADPGRRILYADSKRYLDPKLVILPEALREAGYRTGHFGKWHLGLTPPHWPDKQGFDVTWHCAPDPGPPSYFSPYGVKRGGEPSGRRKLGNITDGPDGEYITDRLTDEALRFVEANKDRPFFLNLWHYGVHGPWGHKEQYTREFASRKDPRGKQGNPIMASMLQSIDESLGRVLDKLDELKLTDRTLLIFYSDNGGNVHSNTPGSRQMNVKPGHPNYSRVLDWKKWAGDKPTTNNSPLREGKGRIYEGGVRVPLMVRWPRRVRPGTTNDAIVGPTDLYPTVLEALGLPRPKGHIIDGESFLPVLQQTGRMKRDALFIWFPHLIPAVAVRQGDWKLIRRFEPHPQYPDLLELYNLKDDIGETTNLAERKPDKAKQLNALIDRFVKETGAAVPKPNPAYRPPSPALGGWQARPGCTLAVRGGLLVMQAEKARVSMQTSAVPKVQGPLVLTLRMRTRRAGRPGIAYWSSARTPGFVRERRRDFRPEADGQWRDYTVTFEPAGVLTGLRLDPSISPGLIEVQSIRLAKPDGTVLKTWEFRTGGDAVRPQS